MGRTADATLTVNHLLKLKKTGIKRSAKKLVLTATMAKINGKIPKNKMVQFKFNGKAYKARTDKNGVASVSIPSKVLKKIRAGQKVTYQASFKKDIVKKTVKVKS